MASLDRIHRIERFEASVWQDAIAGAPPEVVEATGMRAVPIADGVALVADRVPDLLLNRAFAFGLDRPVTEQEIEAAIALYRRDAPFALQPTWHAQPPQLHDWLEKRGLPAYFEWVVWVRDAAPPPRVSAEAEIVRVKRNRADAFGQAVSRVFDKSPALMPWYGALVERPGWSHYAALDGDRIAAVAAMFMRDGIAWLGWGGTLPEYRGQGIQSALIARRIADAVNAGCGELTVETAADAPDRSNPSYRNVARAGFQELHRRPSHAYFPPDAASHQASATDTAT